MVSVTEMQSRVWLSIGSNLERKRNISGCLQTLRGSFGKLIASGVYENEAFGFDGQPFYNLVVGFDSGQSVTQLTQQFRRIEATHGRVRGEDKFSPRTLDIDMLLYGDLVLDDGTVKLPRDEILQFAFVLWPLAEVAGDERHPVLGKTYRQLWEAFNKNKHLLTPVSFPGL